MSDLPPLPDPRLGRYRHYKGGEYEVVGVTRHSETLEPLILYRPLYNQTGLWVRPYAMFFEQVEHDGRLQPRFAPLPEPEMKGDGTSRPRYFPPGEGTTHQLGRMTMTFKTTASQDWNAYTVCEAIEPPESGAGYHRHPTYDETFIICEGNYDFRLDGKLLQLGPGDVVFVPRGTPHGFVCTGPGTGRQLIISSPGGIFDAMIAEVTLLDTGSPTRPASRDAKAVAEKYGLEFLPV